MKATAMISAVLLTGVLAHAPAHAQQVKKGTLTGRIVSAAVEVPGNSSGPLFTTPAKGFFVLTQVCTEDKDADVRGATLGPIYNENKCTTYNPGIGFPQNEAITCVNNNPDPSGCFITGIITRK
jgi:hypothetical protein